MKRWSGRVDWQTTDLWQEHASRYRRAAVFYEEPRSQRRRKHEDTPFADELAQAVDDHMQAAGRVCLGFGVWA